MLLPDFVEVTHWRAADSDDDKHFVPFNQWISTKTITRFYRRGSVADGWYYVIFCKDTTHTGAAFYRVDTSYVHRFEDLLTAIVNGRN